MYLKKMSRCQSTHWTSGVFSQPRQGIPHERSSPRPDSGWEGWWAKVRKCPTLQMPRLERSHVTPQCTGPDPVRNLCSRPVVLALNLKLDLNVCRRNGYDCGRSLAHDKRCSFEYGFVTAKLMFSFIEKPPHGRMPYACSLMQCRPRRTVCYLPVLNAHGITLIDLNSR